MPIFRVQDRIIVPIIIVSDFFLYNVPLMLKKIGHKNNIVKVPYISKTIFFPIFCSQLLIRYTVRKLGFPLFQTIETL